MLPVLDFEQTILTIRNTISTMLIVIVELLFIRRELIYIFLFRLKNWPLLSRCTQVLEIQKFVCHTKKNPVKPNLSQLCKKKHLNLKHLH